MVDVPVPRMLTVFPEMVAAAVLLLVYEMGKPDEVVAVKLNGALPNVLLASEPNEMV